VIEASCHCGAVRLEIDTAPRELTDCACSICWRLGALWAYYSPRQVKISGATRIYMWRARVIEFHSCPVCACTTHWLPADKSYDRMGVNARMMAPEIVAATAIAKFDGPP